MASKPPLVITGSIMAHLRACKAQGLTKTETTAEMGVHLMTLNKAINKADARVQSEVTRMWPHGGQRIGKTKFDNPAVRWLTRTWRVAA